MVKTSLLDYIRKANVIAGEAGGITQHIGAYNVELNDGRHITFLDTPGHEAFTAMRARGAKVTDLAIIIVAADDDVMPQTVEAINHATAAGVPMVFAINKIDKTGCQCRQYQAAACQHELSCGGMGRQVSESGHLRQERYRCGGTYGESSFEAELLDLKANPDRAAIGSVIESSLDKGRGYVATVLVQNGTLPRGRRHRGRHQLRQRSRRCSTSATSASRKRDRPLRYSSSVSTAPHRQATHSMCCPPSRKPATSPRNANSFSASSASRTNKRLGLEELGRRRALNDFHELNLVVKGDVDGSVEALSDSLLKLSTPEIQINVLHKGVGAISESDVTLAAASDAIIIGFQVRPSGAARKEAEKEGVEIRLYSVIYKAIEEVKDAMEGMLSPEIKEEITGTAEVLQTSTIYRKSGQLPEPSCATERSSATPRYA